MSSFAAGQNTRDFPIAEFLPAPTLKSSFSAGAGMAGDNERVYDNRLGQSFTASQTGRIKSVELVVRPIHTDSPKPLTVSIHKIENDLPGDVIASSSILFDSIPEDEELRQLLLARAFTAEAVFEKGPILLGGKRYCIVCSSAESPANYHISGTRQDRVTYPFGEYVDYNRNGEFVLEPEGDLFFRISAQPVNLIPIISVLASFALVLTFLIGYFTGKSRNGSNKRMQSSGCPTSSSNDLP